MLVGRREIAVAAIGQFDEESMRERTLVLNLQTNLHQHFKRHRNDRLIADADGLHNHFFCARGIRRGKAHRVCGVGTGLFVKRREFLGRQGKNLTGLGNLRIGRHAIAQFHLALAHGDSGVVVIGLNVFHGTPGGGGGLGGDHAHLLEGRAWRAFAVKVDVVDVARGAVAHYGHEIVRRIQATDAVRHDARKFPKVIGRGHADHAAILLGDARNAADVM